ncbi:MAG: hypothetical protein NTX56_19780 [Proteobacteria bacterium]|nr:hypothetical protein [Pseudomonadota bacterium]
MIKRRALASLMCLFLIVGLSVGDVRRAEANPVFLPLIIGVAFSTFMGVGTAIEMWDGAPAVSSAVGAKALSVTIANPADGGSAQGAVRVPLLATPDGAAAVPAPSAPGTASGVNNYYCNSAGKQGQGLSASAACDNWISVALTYVCPNYGASGNCYKTGSLDGSSVYHYTMDTYCVSASCVGGYVSGQKVSSDTPYAIAAATGILGQICPTGYSGSPCTLSNARAVTNDGKQDLTRSGTTLAKVAGDLSGQVNAVLSTAYVSNDSADVSGISVSGQPRMVRTTALASGGSEVKQFTEKTDGAGNTYIEQRTYQIDANGTVSGATQTAGAGSLVANAAGTGYGVSGATTGYTPASSGSGSGVAGSGATSTSVSNFPSDYAKAGEAATAAASINSTLGGKLDQIGGSGADPGELVPATTTEFDQAFFQGTFTNLLGWQLPAHTSTCPTASFSFRSNTYTIDSHCQLVATYFGSFSSVMGVVWTIAALFVLLAA